MLHDDAIKDNKKNREIKRTTMAKNERYLQAEEVTEALKNIS